MAGLERLHRVRVQTARGLVEFHWDEREALLRELEVIEGALPVIDKIG